MVWHGALDALLPPADGPRRLDRHRLVGVTLVRRGLIALLRDVELEHVGGAVLRVAVIKDLVEELVWRGAQWAGLDRQAWGWRGREVVVVVV